MKGFTLTPSFKKRTFYTTLLLLALGLCNAVVAQVPSVTSFSPTTACQGALITIKGSNFTGATSVKLGTLINTSITVVDDNTITANIPDASTDGSVTVTNPNGTGTGGNITIKPAPIPNLTHVGVADPFTNCNGNATYTLNVSNSASQTVSGSSYTIDWGDGVGAFAQNDWASGAQTLHTYTSQGYFTINFTITPPNGCARTKSITFYNGQNPISSFTTSTPTTGLCTPSPIQFQIGNWFNNSAGTTYLVNFGDGTPIQTLSHPLSASNITYLLSHTYNTSSCPNPDYTATLQAKNGCFTTTYTLNQIVIRKKPVVDFTVPDPNCINNQVCFVNNTANGYSGNTCSTLSNFTWDFGDGSPTVTSMQPCHTYATAGTYTVTLTANNASCGSDSKSKQITVLTTSPVPTVTTPVVYCKGQTASPLTATGTGTFLWYTTSTGGTGSPTAPTPSTANVGSVTYYVSQSLAGSCESQRVPITVTVNALPAAPTVTTPIQLCVNQAASPLTAGGTGLLWYTTATGGTGSSTAPTPATNTTGQTTYYVSQTTTNCEGPRAAIVVNVNDIANAPVVISPLTYCQNQSAPALTATGSGLLWYTSATGGTGSGTAPVPSTATPGSTTYYVSQSSSCGESPRAAITVNVNAAPTASIAYATTSLCNVVNSGTNPNPPIPVTITGTTGGVFSVSPAGLTVNTTTGEINPSGATANTYTIKYSIAGSGGCAVFTTTATVTVSGTPQATITYPAAVCTSTGATPANINGTQGGSFSSTTGLVIDAITGVITPAGSTPGTYTVTYTVLPSAPCPGFSTTTTITITAAPTASISYATPLLCNTPDGPTSPNPPISVTQTGSTGGTYSVSPATGLAINSTTGTITPANATPNTYTITYTIPGAGGCPVYTATTKVTITGTPTATIKYPASPYCRGISTLQQVSSNGNTGGIFSAPTGLSIDAATGAINPSLSTPGVYTVTYTIAASAPCPGFVTTTSVQIDDSPVLTFPNSSQSICSGGTASYAPSSTVANTVYTWAVVGALPFNVTGVNAGTVSGSNAVIALSFKNTGTTSQVLTIKVTPTNPSQNPCAGAPYNLTLQVNPFPVALLPDTFRFCMGTPATAITANPAIGNTINWYDNNLNPLNAAPIVSTSQPTQFVFYVSQSNSYGCESPKTKIPVIVPPTAKITSASYKNPTACGIPSGSIVLNVLDLNGNPIPNTKLYVHYNKFQTALSMYDSTDANGKITMPLSGGTYSNIYVETSGCLSQKIPDVFVLSDPNPPAQPVAGYNPPLCSESLLNLTASSATSTLQGAVDYIWAGPAFGPLPDTVRNTFVSFPSASMSFAGTYVVYAVQNNCVSAPTSFEVVLKQSPTKPIISTRAPLCIGDALVLQAYSTMPGNTAINYVWKGPNANFPVFAPNAGIDKVTIQDAGIYSITVSSPLTGCSTTTDTLIGVGDYPLVKFPQDTLTLPAGYLLKPNAVITNATKPGVLPMKKYEWTPSVDVSCNDSICSDPTIAIKNNGCYNLKVTNVYGCSGTAAFCVKVLCAESQLFIPNAFTPTGNIPGNTKLVVRASGIGSVRSFRVYNRWGKVVFERSNFPPNSSDYGWDGRINGKLADPGVYIYTADVICDNGIPYTYKGNVTLL